MAKILMKGNEAFGRAAIEAGCHYFFGYPITPQSELPEYLSRELPKVGGAFVQAESELAAINMVYGAVVFDEGFKLVDPLTTVFVCGNRSRDGQ